mgnify:CR=1 FL=1
MEGLFGEAVLPWIYSVGLLVLGTYAAVRPDLIRDVDVRVLLASLLVIAVVLCLLTTWWQSRCRSYRCSDCGHVDPNKNIPTTLPKQNRKSKI